MVSGGKLSWKGPIRRKLLQSVHYIGTRYCKSEEISEYQFICLTTKSDFVNFANFRLQLAH